MLTFLLIPAALMVIVGLILCWVSFNGGIERQRICEACNYSLRGNATNVCSECGKEQTCVKLTGFSPQQRSDMLIVGWVLAFIGMIPILHVFLHTVRPAPVPIDDPRRVKLVPNDDTSWHVMVYGLAGRTYVRTRIIQNVTATVDVRWPEFQIDRSSRRYKYGEYGTSSYRAGEGIDQDVMLGFLASAGIDRSLDSTNQCSQELVVLHRDLLDGVAPQEALKKVTAFDVVRLKVTPPKQGLDWSVACILFALALLLLRRLHTRLLLNFPRHAREEPAAGDPTNRPSLG